MVSVRQTLVVFDFGCIACICFKHPGSGTAGTHTQQTSSQNGRARRWSLNLARCSRNGSIGYPNAVTHEAFSAIRVCFLDNRQPADSIPGVCLCQERALICTGTPEAQALQRDPEDIKTTVEMSLALPFTAGGSGMGGLRLI